MQLELRALRATVSTFAGIALLAGAAVAADVNVMISGGFTAAYMALTPAFEKATGNKVITTRGPSMGETPQAIPNRLQRGEPADVVIMVGEALDALIAQGRVVPGSRTELARSNISMAVKAGAPKPDISSIDAFRNALVAAKSIAYSDSASGVYLSTVVFPRLGIAEQMKGKARMIPATPVGEIVARGEAELGFQQTSELLPVAGIDIVGEIPREVQKTTVFSAGIVATSKQPEVAKALIAHLASPEAALAVKNTGMVPVAK